MQLLCVMLFVSLSLSEVMDAQSKISGNQILQKKVNAVFDGASVKDVFMKIQQETGLKIVYKAEILAYQQGDSLIALPHHPTCLLYFPKDSISYTLQRGEQLAIHARMQPPHNFGNIGFDYARYLKRKGIAATAYVPMNSWKLIGKDTLIGWREKADRYREKIAAYYHRLGFRGDELGVLTALTIGEKEELSEEISETYSVAGASHVLALSGLHVGLLAWLLMVCFGLFIRYWPALRPLLVLLTLCLLGSFAYFTGLSPSVVRAVIMFSLLAIVRLWRNEPLTLNVVAFTVFIMLCFKPIWLFDVGFQLSFSAVFARYQAGRRGIQVCQARRYSGCRHRLIQEDFHYGKDDCLRRGSP